MATGQFNIGMVVEETGVPADTLRVWERRYGLPNPDRSTGGHRLYSAEDIQTIHWLVGSKQRGLSIRRAVELWQQNHAGARPSQPQALPELEGSFLEESRANWLDACRAFDEQRAEAAMASAFARYPAEAVVGQLLMAGLAELGEAWQRNQVTVQQEHFASALIARRLHTLIAACPPPTRAQTVLLACPPGEEHDLPLLYFAWRLRREGWPVVFLGEDVPQDHLVPMLQQVRPALVVLAASHLPAAGDLHQMATVVQANGIPLAYGGRAFIRYPELRRYIPGYFLGEGFEGASRELSNLLERDLVAHEAETAPAPVLPAAAALQTRLEAISLAVASALSRAPVNADRISISHEFWTRCLLAALYFGESKVLLGELEWVAALLDHRGMPSQLLVLYLQAYQQIAEEHLQGEYRPVLDEIRNVVSRYLASIQ